MDGDKRAYVLVAGSTSFSLSANWTPSNTASKTPIRGLYQELRGYLGKPRKTTSDPLPPELTYARYGLWHYVKIAKQKHEPYASLHRAGANLRGLIRVLLFKRFESSVFAFQETIRRLLRIHNTFLKALDEGFVPAGRGRPDAPLRIRHATKKTICWTQLRKCSTTYNADDFDFKTLRAHIEHDIEILEKILALVEPITPEQDAKLQTLIKRFGAGTAEEREAADFHPIRGHGPIPVRQSSNPHVQEGRT